MELASALLTGGWAALVDYLSAHVLLCLVPAFFIAGALSALFPKETVTRYLGPDARPYVSYPAAAAAGLLLAVCSCTILPLFAGIWRKGAGLGPAITFLFIGPAINILAITYTGTLIGMDIAGARAVLAVAFGITIGVIMAALFWRGEATSGRAMVVTSSQGIQGRTTAFFGALVLVLLAGTAQLDPGLKYGLLAFPVLATVGMAGFALPRDETLAWLSETWRFARMILPLLLVGVFVAGMAKVVIPQEIVQAHVGGNTLSANLIAVAFGVFMYFPTLVEVPVARMFLDLGMAKGPLLAYLLADPELSLQSVLVTGRIMGWRRNGVYVALVAVFATVAGLIFGAVVG